MKKGFTLIELLAVIVILAIIALIAVPIVLNIIDDSKESSLLRSAEFYLDAVEYTIADAFLYHGGLEDKKYPIDINGDICKIELDNEGNCPKTGNVSNTLKVEVNGDKPTGGSITINGGNISSVEIVLDEKTIVKNSKGELVYLKYLDEVCTLVSGTAKTAGAKYTCKVDPNKEAYTFYVLTTPSATDTSINLIMDRNICSDGTVTEEGKTCFVEWISKDHYGTLYPYDEDVCWNESGCALNDKGPITAMDYLYNATKAWTNTNEILVDKFDNDAGSKFDMQAYNTYARLPFYSEVGNFNNNNGYLFDYLDGGIWDYGESTKPTNNISGIYGYWTLSFDADYSNIAWFVRNNGFVSNFDGVEDSYVDSEYRYGVRPVVNLKI